MINYWISFLFIILFNTNLLANSDSISQPNWIRNKIAFGRSQHIQYFGNKNKASTLFNKAYYLSFAPVNLKGFKPFLGISYEYFFTKAACLTCESSNYKNITGESIHFINFSSAGAGFSYELTFKTKKGKEVEMLIGASLERFIFKKAYILQKDQKMSTTTPFVSTNQFYNHYFFKDMIGFRAYNDSNYKVFVQLSGLVLRNERLYYSPINYTFHNFMLGFKVFLK